MRKRSLQSRILILVGIGVALLFATIGTASYLAITQSVDRLLNERLVLAQATADNLERSVYLSLRRLGNTIGPSYDPADGLEAETRAMRQASWDSLFGDTVFLLDDQGRALAHVPEGTRTFDPQSIREAVAAALRGRGGVTGVVELGSSGRRIVAGLEPVRNADGKVTGVIGGGIDLTGNSLRELIEPRRLGELHSVDIVDASGTVLASTRPDRMYARSDHKNLVAGLIRERKTTVVECHSCHEHTRDASEMMALAPLESIPWAVAIREDRGLLLRPAHRLRTAVLVIGALFLVGAMLMTLASVRSVVGPIRTLTKHVRTLTAGHLDEPVPALGEDEIGELADHVEKMRMRLRDSLAEIRGWNVQLEREVARRTAQAEGVAAQNAELYRELRKKEAGRSQLLRKIITAQEDERKRVARDLHDSTAQELAALMLRLDAFRTANPETAERVAPIKALAEEILGEVHRLIFDLRPALLDDLGLPTALRWLCDKQFKGGATEARFELAGTERRLPAELETTLFRIAQEAIINIGRHAQATQVVVRIDYSPKGVAVEVEDDGVGFDPAMVQPSGRDVRGLGLLGMRERVELWEGTVAVDSAPEQGTRIEVFVPYPGKGEQHADSNPVGG